MALKQIIWGGCWDALASGDYVLPFLFSNSTTEGQMTCSISCPGTIKGMIVRLSVAPGSGDSRTFTLKKNGSFTSLAVVLSESEVFDEGWTDIAVSAGDTIAIFTSLTGSPSTSYVSVALIFEPTTSKEYLVFATDSGNTGQIECSGLNCRLFNSSSASAKSVMPCSGTLKSLYVRVTAAPGTSKSWTITVYKNGSPTDLGVVISEGETADSDTVDSVTFAQGDEIYLHIAPAGTPAAAYIQIGLCFQPDTDGWSPMFGLSNDPLNSTITEYNWVQEGSSLNSWTSTENDREFYMPVRSLIRNLTILLQTAPGSGKSRIFTLRRNVGDTSVVATLSDAETTDNSGANTVMVEPQQELALEHDPETSPDACTYSYWSAIMIYSLQVVKISEETETITEALIRRARAVKQINSTEAITDVLVRRAMASMVIGSTISVAEGLLRFFHISKIINSMIEIPSEERGVKRRVGI